MTTEQVYGLLGVTVLAVQTLLASRHVWVLRKRLGKALESRNVWEGRSLTWEWRYCALTRKHHTYVGWTKGRLDLRQVCGWFTEYEDMLRREQEDNADSDRIGYGRPPRASTGVQP